MKSAANEGTTPTFSNVMDILFSPCLALGGFIDRAQCRSRHGDGNTPRGVNASRPRFAFLFCQFDIGLGLVASERLKVV
jgi:hypothetical protein